MTDSIKELGVVTAVLERFTTQRLPKALALEEKVERGEPVDDYDLAFLHETLHNLEAIKPTVDHHPEYQDLYARVTQLYQHITEMALKNEKPPGFGA
jgi:hypothetical protein